MQSLFTDRPNLNPIPDPSLPSVPAPTWRSPVLSPRFRPAITSPGPSALRPNVQPVPPPACTDFHKWSASAPRFPPPEPSHPHRPNLNPVPPPPSSDYHKWNASTPRFPPSIEGTTHPERPCLQPVPPALSPHRVRDWAKQPDQDRFPADFKPVKRPRQPYPNYLGSSSSNHKAAASRGGRRVLVPRNKGQQQQSDGDQKAVAADPRQAQVKAAGPRRLVVAKPAYGGQQQRVPVGQDHAAQSVH